MRIAIYLCALLAAVGGLGAAIAARGSAASPPIGSITTQDAVGDAGASPDIASLAATVSADQVLTLSLTFANRSAMGQNESLDFFLRPLSGPDLGLATFDNTETRLSVLSGSDWVSIVDIGGTWSGNTFSVSVGLDTLRDAAHAPVVPTLWVSAGAFVGPDGNAPTRVDAVPDSGWTLLSTEASAAPAPVTMTTTATTTAPQPTVTSPATTPKTAGMPHLDSKIEPLSNHRLEWKRLAVEAVPAGSAVTIACTKVCKLSESLQATGGVAVSKRFVGVPLARGATFLVRVVKKGGTGYWFRETVVGDPGGQETTSARGCIAKAGALVSLASC